MKRTLLLLLTMLLPACRAAEISTAGERAAELEGAWRLVASETRTPEGSTRSDLAQESLLVFVGDFYSMGWAGGKPARPYQEQFSPTKEEKLARYSSLIVNAGRYVVTENTLTIRPVFALVPEYVGGIGEFEYALEGDTLRLVWTKIVSVDGVPDPGLAAGYRYVYTWVRIK